MADNIAVTAGSGTTVHADEYTHSTLGSGKTQLVKMVDGTLNSDTPVATGNGTATNAMRVTVASDSTGVVSVDDNGGSLTVDSTKLDDIETNTNYGAVTGGGTEASALRVTVANDSTGVVSVDDNGSSLTVDGTVTANLSATDNAVLDDIAANQTDASQKTQIVDGAGNVIGSTSNALDVNIASGSSSGTQYTDADAEAAPTGTVAMGTDGSNVYAVATDTSGHLQVDVLSGGGGGTQYTEGDTDASITGTAMMMEGATNTLVAAQGTAADGLLVNLGSNNDVTVTNATAANLKVDGSDVTQPVSGTVTANLSATDNAVLDQIDSNTDYGAVTGGGTETGALRVTLANNSTGVVSVDDNGGSLTVDGTVTETNSAAILADTANIDTNVGTIAGAVSGTEMQVDVVGSLPAGTNAIGKLSANSGVDIGDVDVTSVTPGTGATDLGKAEDAAHTTGDVGVMALSVRTNTATARAGTDGDYQPLITDTNGRLHVKLPSNEPVNVAQMNGVNVTMGNGASGTGVQRVTIASDSTGQVALASGTNSIGKLGANSGVDIGDVDVTSVVPGTGASNLGKTEDAVHSSGDVGVMALAVRSNADDAIAGDGDYHPLVVDANGMLKTDPRGVAAEDTASSNGDYGFPAMARRTASPADTSGSDGDYEMLQMDNGRLWTSSTIDAALPAGSNTIGDVGITPRTSGGLSIFRSIDIDESEEEIKSTAGQLFSITAFNTTDAPIYLKFYNATAASVVVGTTTPVLTFVVPGNSNSDGSGFVWNNEIGLAFGTAMTVAATTGVADSDTGAPGANACIVNIGYK